jgi:hypothetical protein
LDTDEVAKNILETLTNVEDRNEEVLYNYLDDMEEDSIFKGSSSALSLFSLLNLSLWRKDCDLFRSTITKVEKSMLQNSNFFKPMVNFIHYFCFYTLEKFDKVDRLKYYEAIAYFAWKFLSVNLKSYFSAIYDDNDEYDGDREAKTLHSVYFQVIDLVIGVISKTPSKKLKYLNSEMVEQLFATLQNFIDTDKNPANKEKWARLLRKLMCGIDREVLGHWIRSIPLDKSKYQTPRLRRLYNPPYKLEEDQPLENNSSVLLQVLKNYLDHFRTLEPEQSLTAMSAVQHMILSIPNDKLTWFEKEYLKEAADMLITRTLNEKDRTLTKRIKQLLVEVGKRFRTVLEVQLKDAEERSRVRRMDLLKEVWTQIVN